MGAAAIETLVLQLLQAIPALYETVQTALVNGQITDITALQTALTAAQTAAQTDFSQLLKDMGQPDPG